MSNPEIPDTNRYELVFEASGTVDKGTAGEEPDDEGENS